jgi:hypothetical protein
MDTTPLSSNIYYTLIYYFIKNNKYLETEEVNYITTNHT